jgi:hypothetical protein
MSTNPNNLCVNQDGDVVLLVKLWQRTSSVLYLSVYGLTGWKAKRRHLLHRERVNYDAFNLQVATTHAHLWALRNGVSNFVVVDKYDDIKKLFHPRKEYQNVL